MEAFYRAVLGTYNLCAIIWPAREYWIFRGKVEGRGPINYNILQEKSNKISSLDEFHFLSLINYSWGKNEFKYICQVLLSD